MENPDGGGESEVTVSGIFELEGVTTGVVDGVEPDDPVGEEPGLWIDDEDGPAFTS